MGAGRRMAWRRMVWAVTGGVVASSLGQYRKQPGTPICLVRNAVCKSVFPQRPACGEWCWADGISQGPPVNICCSHRMSGSGYSELTRRFVGDRAATSVY